MIAVLVAVCIVAVATPATWLVWQTTSFRRIVVQRRVVVNLKTGSAIEGVLIKRSGPLLLLRDVVVHDVEGGSNPADGEFVIERPNVDYIQKP